MRSHPTNSPVKSYPALDLIGLCRVSMAVSSRSAIVKENTQIFVVPDLYAFVPEHPKKGKYSYKLTAMWPLMKFSPVPTIPPVSSVD